MPKVVIGLRVYVVTESKKPTGLAITRKNNTFKFSWKKGDKNYARGQQLYYKTNQMKKWKRLPCGARVTNKSITLDMSKYIPTTEKALRYIRFKVRGRREPYTKHTGTRTKTRYAPSMSDFAVKEFEIKKPNAPKVTANLSDELANRTTFSWTTSTSNSSNRYFSVVQWQTVLLKNSNVTKGKDAFSQKQKSSRVSGTWEAGTGSANDSKAVTEDLTYINGTDSYTRWFRARARGPAGSSAWTYSNHVYARTNATSNTKATAIKEAGGYKVTVEWSSSMKAARPINQMIVQSWVTAPGAGMGVPEGAGWQDMMTVAYKDGTDKAIFYIDDVLTDDQAIFVRVNTQHDPGVPATPGTPVIAEVGSLATPTITSVTPVEATHRATIVASNASSVPDSFLAVYYQSDEDEPMIVGIIEHGETTATVQAPDWSTAGAYAFGVQAVVGTYSEQEGPRGLTVYSLQSYEGKPMMTSGITWGAGAVPKAPENVAVTATDATGVLRVNWNWTWTEATSAEISWSQNPYAWESNEQPATYTVSNANASQWYITGLDVGVEWYVRVRLAKGSGDELLYGPYSEAIRVSLASAPSVPTLVLSDAVIPGDGTVTASWAYVSTDGTAQAYAEICTATLSQSGITYGDTIATTETAQHIDINAAKVGWTVGETYLLCLRVVSASGRTSDDWSAPVALAIAEPLTAEITQTSLTSVVVPEDEEEGTTEMVTALADMPLTITVTGAGNTGITTVAIERAESYYLERPDERNFTGHEGETVALIQQTGEAQITIDDSALIGSLDDGAKYRIVATVSDELGQSAEATQDFEVRWTHQALIPTATIEADNNFKVMKITPVAPEGVETGDTCDIYRLSVDRPELIYPGAEFGTTYVDPYPALGEMGGHRIVFRTANGDYITEDNTLAWTDYTAEDGDTIETMFNLIDFGGNQVAVMYDIELSSAWDKDFEETQYLGGHVTGDWNQAVSRTGSVQGSLVTTQDQDTIQALRRLADYPGICHVRTRDGSSYAADVQVNESRDMGKDVVRSEFSLAITRVDPEGYDGMTLADWQRTQEPEEATVGTAEVGTATVG